MITWQREDWASYRRDCDGLWVEHYDEIAVQKSMKMKPDEPAYRALDASGQLDVLVGRKDGQMVGYVLSVVRPHLHYADSLCGFEDGYFLTKPERRGMAGVRLIREWEASMRARGCQRWFIMTKPFLDMGPVLKRLGYSLTDYVYAKSVGA